MPICVNGASIMKADKNGDSLCSSKFCTVRPPFYYFVPTLCQVEQNDGQSLIERQFRYKLANLSQNWLTGNHMQILPMMHSLTVLSPYP